MINASMVPPRNDGSSLLNTSKCVTFSKKSSLRKSIEKQWSDDEDNESMFADGKSFSYRRQKKQRTPMNCNDRCQTVSYGNIAR